jgi:hypothetical protein
MEVSSKDENGREAAMYLVVRCRDTFGTDVDGRRLAEFDKCIITLV